MSSLASSRVLDPSPQIRVGERYRRSPFVELGGEKRVIQIEKPEHLVEPRGGLEDAPVAEPIHARDFSPGAGFVKFLDRQQLARERVMIGVVHVVKVNRSSGEAYTLSIEQSKAIPRARPVVDVDGNEADHLTWGQVEPTQCFCDVAVNDGGVGRQGVFERARVAGDEITPKIFLRMVPVVNGFRHPRARIEADDTTIDTVVARKPLADAAEVKQSATGCNAELYENDALQTELCAVSGSKFEGLLQTEGIGLARNEIVFDLTDYVPESGDTKRDEVVDQGLAKTLAVQALPNSRLKKFLSHLGDLTRSQFGGKEAML